MNGKYRFVYTANVIKNIKKYKKVEKIFYYKNCQCSLPAVFNFPLQHFDMF